jgi:hypothetical protein
MVKVLVSLSTLWRRGGGEKWRYNSTLFNTLAVDGSEWSALYPQYFTPGERAPVSMNRELGPQSQSGCSGKNINLLYPAGNQTKICLSSSLRERKSKYTVDTCNSNWRWSGTPWPAVRPLSSMGIMWKELQHSDIMRFFSSLRSDRIGGHNAEIYFAESLSNTYTGKLWRDYEKGTRTLHTFNFVKKPAND